MNDALTPPTQSTPKIRKRRQMPSIAKLALWSATAIFIFTVVGAAGLWAWLLSMENQLEQKRAEIRAAGHPVTLEELDAWYPQVPDEENAALLYIKAFDELEVIAPGHKRVEALRNAGKDFDHIKDYPPDYIAELRKFALDSDSALLFLELAARKTQARFPIDMTQGLSVEFPHLDELRNAARVLCMASEVALLDSNIESATNRHAAILCAGRALRNEPNLLSQLVRLAIDKFAVDSLERLLNHALLGDEDLRILNSAYTDAYLPEMYRDTLLAERCTAVDTIRRLLDGKGEPFDGLDLLGVFKEVRWARHLFTMFLSPHEQLQLYDAFETLIPELNQDWPDTVARAREIAHNEYPGTIMTAILMPVIPRSAFAFARNVATLRIARTAIAIERYRLAHSTPPDSLANLVPTYLDAVPEDPFDGKPLRYRRETTGYTLYSIFDDGIDDNGTPWTKDEDKNKIGDLVFTITR